MGRNGQRQQVQFAMTVCNATFKPLTSSPSQTRGYWFLGGTLTSPVVLSFKLPVASTRRAESTGVITAACLQFNFRNSVGFVFATHCKLVPTHCSLFSHTSYFLLSFIFLNPFCLRCTACVIFVVIVVWFFLRNIWHSMPYWFLPSTLLEYGIFCQYTT